MRTIVFNGRTVNPSKIICVGKNYAAHIEEMNSAPSDLMTLFMKPNSSITDELISYRGEPMHFEGEICLLIEHNRVAGIGFGLDLTKRATQAALKSA
ncbi:MAG: fumarylacetoacetate hydrolase family protein, partial [Luminiphilus sp.]|nr:fumarylacetoacetate hydrolase family protein [Luminiphilus sp.]